MHDNAPPHTAVDWLLEQGGIAVLLWPAQSLDMNPIEHAWDMLQRSVTPAVFVYGTFEYGSSF